MHIIFVKVVGWEIQNFKIGFPVKNFFFPFPPLKNGENSSQQFALQDCSLDKYLSWLERTLSLACSEILPLDCNYLLASGKEQSRDILNSLSLVLFEPER